MNFSVATTLRAQHVPTSTRWKTLRSTSIVRPNVFAGAYPPVPGVSVSRAQAFSRNHRRPHGSAAFSLHQDAASALSSRSHSVSQASTALADHPGSARGCAADRFGGEPDASHHDDAV